MAKVSNIEVIVCESNIFETNAFLHSFFLLLVCLMS